MMPALLTAWRIQQRASEIGFDWPDPGGAGHKLREELEEFREAPGKGRMRIDELPVNVVNYRQEYHFKLE